MTTSKLGLVVGVDGSEGSNAAVAWAARDAVLAGLNETLRTEGAATVLRDRLETLADRWDEFGVPHSAAADLRAALRSEP